MKLRNDLQRETVLSSNLELVGIQSLISNLIQREPPTVEKAFN